MTKEQEEKIKDIKIYIHDYISESFDEDGYTQYEISEEEEEFFNNIETVLNMLKEKDGQIAKYEKIYKEYDCYRWVKELEKKDKIIDYMIDWIRERSIYAIDSHEKLKQYFEQKATNNG